jgi:microcystin degradation protein MlrC
VPAVVDCEMIAMIHTTREPARGFVDRIKAMEGKDGIVSISVTHGFPWGDVPDMGTKLLVYADGDAAKAQRVARTLADELIGLREALDAPSPGVDAALDQALAFEGGPVVIADGADNPGGGAPGDSTVILRRIVERGITNVALGPLWDPIAVRIAFDAGVGATLPMRIGGKIGPLSGDPIDLSCTVKALEADMQMTGLGGSMQPLGDCALVEAVGAGPLPSRLRAPSGGSERSERGGSITYGIEIVLITQRSQAMDTDLFTQLGCDLAAKKIVVVKSSQHFYASYSKVAKRVLYASAPGVVTGDLRSLPYRRIKRPKWPL